MRCPLALPHHAATLVLMLSVVWAGRAEADLPTGTRADGLRLGPNGVGFELLSGIDLDKFAEHHALELAREAAHEFTAKQALRIPIGETLDHGE